jgi:molybdopterin synthase sulfur carrier subunit
MKIEVNFFGTYREIVGRKQIVVELEKGVNVKALLEKLCAEYPDLKKKFFKGDKFSENVMVLLNGQNIIFLNTFDTEIKDTSKVSILSPISGG